jgi:two-component system chemotaxis response regulator CheY
VSDLAGIVDDVHDLKVLVVDDKANMRRTIKSMLRSMGFQKFADADDGDVALRMIESEPFDMVICDWNMPRMKGVSVLREIRKEKQYDDMPFLMVTGEVEEGRVAESIEAEVDAYVIKPFQIQTLEEKLIQILSKRRTPSALDLLFREAEEHRNHAQYGLAHKTLDKAAQIRPRSPMLQYQRGMVFEAERKTSEAEKCYALARQLGPLFIRAHDKLAHIHQARGRTAEVCNILQEAVKISPNNANRQIRLGRALLVEKRFTEARKAFKKAIALDKNNQNRKLAIGQTYLQHDLVADAEDIFKQFVEEHPDNIEAYNRLGMVLRRAGKHDEAVKYYRHALEVAPNDQNLHFNLARVYQEINRRDLAAIHLRKALEIDPKFNEARTLLSQMKTGEY